ncbi:Methylthioribose-1-phosphate isomerase [Dacryopinax primogenitus]|uniref:Methylthioribose-1-phosphate isomerase n=1 Tax=Dacryopinax primogenitus (strain DJM 731) TaxID=1858805 RepID=M5G7V6_DACPD|nr:Methylthioribose-1-phosphate isomerase [Dacryopinax primogenitus]EJU04215.1 Methylthioribose-1-phosphate isomerase [Dacryopinax primogenitus]
MTSIRTNGDEIEIVDQLLLPHVVRWVPVLTPEDAYDAIKSMKIRGAPAIASLAALSIARYISLALSASPPPSWLSTPAALSSHLSPILDHLLTSRPTAVNLSQAITRIRSVFSKGEAQLLSGGDTALAVIAESRAVADEDVGRNKAMSRLGAEWVLAMLEAEGTVAPGEPINVLTVCNTGSLATSGYGTALGLITHLHEQGRLGRAFYTQSAPYHQGTRLTALELLTLGVPSTMLCDTMVGSLMQHFKVHAVAVGADRVAKNGDTANKIGTYNAAVLAKRHGVPFLVVAPVSTLDPKTPSGKEIPIEHRPPMEAVLARGVAYPPKEGVEAEQVVVQIAPPNLSLEGIYNPSFDVTPAELITAIVTENGVVENKGGEVIDLSSVL